MYVYLPADTRTLHVSVMNDPLIAIENCQNVTLSKLTFEYGRSIGIYLENTHHVRITGCTIRNVGGVGISIGRGTETPDKQTLKPHAAEAGGDPKSRVVGDLMGRVYQDIYNPQIQIFAKSETKRPNFGLLHKTKRSKNSERTT